jgi:polyisoprenoid-binding protein YceI
MDEATDLSTGSIEAPPSGEWKLDQAHTSLSFVARYLMLTKVRGRFTGFDGTLHIGTTAEDSWAEVSIDAASIDTDNETRDEHLRSPDFLAVEKFPTLTFRSTGIERTGQSTLTVSGDLTIRGVTRPVVLDAEYHGITKGMRGDTRVAFSATTELDRDEWGVSWNMALETGGVVVGKRVRLELEVQAILQQQGEKDPAAG